MNYRILLNKSSLHSTDCLLIIFWGFLSITSISLYARLESWWVIPSVNTGAVLLVLAMARAARVTGSRVLRLVHDWSAFPFVIFTFEQLYSIIRAIHHGRDYDQFLIKLDQAIFRANPTQWLANYSHPLLTELLQIAYSLFYAVFLIIGLELYRNRDKARFREFRFTIVYGFLLSYLGYLALPSIGPRFTLHDFSSINTDLPGLFLTPGLRWFVNVFEAIRPGMSSAVAQASALRDVFPSGHTMMTIVAVVLAYRFRLKVRSFILVNGILLVIGTVYLRYHYVVDLLAGAGLGVFCLLTSMQVQELFRKNLEGPKA